MNKSKIKNIGIFILVAISFTFCKKDDVVLDDDWQDFTRPLNIAAPVFTGNFYATDLLEMIDSTSFIYTDSDGVIHFKYAQPIEAEWNDLIKIDEIELDNNYDLSVPTTKSAKAVDARYVDRVKVNLLGEQRFDSLYIYEAVLEMVVNPPIGSMVGDYTISFPELVKDGVALSFIGNFNSNLSTSVNLAEYKLLFKQGVDSSYFDVITEVSNLAPGSSPASTMMGVNVKMLNLIPETTFGYFGQMVVIDEKMDLDFDFFKNFDFSDIIQVKGVTLTLDVDNYFGVEFATTLNNAIARNTAKGTEVELILGDNNVLTLGAAEYAETVIPKTNFIQFDHTNSNIDDVINIFPDQIEFDILGESNPSGTVNENFVSRNNKFEGEFSIDLPFWFKSTNYNRTDTINFDVRNILDSSSVEMVNKLGLYFDFINGFPFDIKAQAYLADANNVIIDSLFNEGITSIWESGAIDVNGKVSSPVETNVNIELDQEKVKKLYDNKVTQIFIASYVTTADNGSVFVKLYEEYEIEMKFAFEVQSGSISTK